MSLGKGINSHIGYGGEVTFGVKGTIDLFSCMISETLRHVKDPFMSECLTDGWHDDVYYSAGRNEGSVVFSSIYTGHELYWHSLFGTYVFGVDTPVAGAHQHAFTFVPSTNSFPVGISIEAVRGIGGTSEQTFLGMHVTKATIEFANRQILRTTFDMLGTGTSFGAATVASFPVFKPVLPAHKVLLQLGGNTFTVLSGTIEFEVPRDGAREHYGEALFKEAVIEGRPVASFSLVCEHNDATSEDTEAFVQDYIAGNEIVGLALQHQGDIIVGATKYDHSIAGNKAFITAAFPSAQDPGINQLTIDGMITEGLALTMINATGTIVT